MSERPRPEKRWRLRTRLALAMVAVILPLQVVVTLSHRDNLNERRETEIENAVVVGRTVAGVVDGFIRDLEAFSLAAALALGAQERPFDEPRTYAYLDHLNGSYDLLRAIFITDLNGRVISTRDGQNVGVDLSHRAYIRDLQEGALSVWSSGVVGSESGLTTVAHSRVILDLDENPRGYLVAAFYPERLIDRLPDDLPEDAKVVFLDAAGGILYASSDPGSIGLQANLRGTDFIDGALAGATQRISDRQTPFGDGKRYGAYVPVASNGWVVGFTRPQAPMEASLQNRFYRDVALTSLALLAGVGLMLFIADRISRPLTSLAGAAAAIASGERPVVPAAEASHEVMQLEKAMQTLSRSVAEREEQLREQARVLAALERVGASVASELDYQTAAQAVTDAATELTAAEFGAFFFKERDEGDLPFTATGADPGQLASMALLQWVSGASEGAGQIVRIDDLTGRTNGGREPVEVGFRSFLAVPVTSRSSEPLGVLVFGHSLPGVFTSTHEELAAGIARWAAIAIDNARLYKQAREAQEQLRLSNRAKDEFVGIISHELRTPITTIYGTARLLESRRGKLDPATESDLMSNLTQEAERMHRLVEDLLAVARTELGKETLTEPLLLEPVITRVARSFGEKRPERQLILDLPDSPPPVMGDNTYLEQVLTNLLTNADKYGGASEPIEVIVRPGLRKSSSASWTAARASPRRSCP
jgi:signal transduction histidine kinase